MNKKYMVLGNGLKDCGPACLLSIMKYYNVDVSLDEVSYILKTDMNGTNAYNIINGSRTFGFDGYGIHYTYEEIINNNISFPIICHVIKDNNYHFIVVYKIDAKHKRLIVMDPSTKRRYISFEEFKVMYQNTSLVIYLVKIIDNYNSHIKLFDYILSFIKKEYKSVILVFILSIIVIILGLISNYYLMIVIDKIVSDYEFIFLIKISITFLIIMLSKSVLSYIETKIFIKVSNNISININNDIVRHLFNLPYLFFKNKSTGEVISRINDLKSFREIVLEIIVNLMMDSILIVFGMIILLIINSKLFMINFISMILYLIIVLLFSRSIVKKSDEVLINEGLYNKSLNESIYGYETNKNLNMINESNKNNEIKYISYIHSIKSYESLLSKETLIKDILVNITYIISIILGVIFINNNVITLGEFILFNSLIYYFTDPIKNILDYEPNYSYIKNVYRRISDLVLMRENTFNMSNNMIKGDINFECVEYSYNKINTLFDAVSFKIKYGTKFLVYGNSGNGKSTLIKLLLKYISEYKGQIYINNTNIKDIDSSIIGNSFTYVSQNSYINNDTLINNIKYGRNIDENDYENIIDLINLKSLRDNNVLRNNFMIEENGFNISGGERQKNILARSLLKKSNYIILDEALSEIGLYEEKEIINKMFKYFSDKTIIYITHKKEIIELFKEKYKLERRGYE